MSAPPLDTVVLVAPPPLLTCNRPLLRMIALTAEPYTTSAPPLLTVVALAAPPLSTTSALPLVTTIPELTTPEDTN
jgi:hypothetical protein